MVVRLGNISILFQTALLSSQNGRFMTRAAPLWGGDHHSPLTSHSDRLISPIAGVIYHSRNGPSRARILLGFRMFPSSDVFSQILTFENFQPSPLDHGTMTMRFSLGLAVLASLSARGGCKAFRRSDFPQQTSPPQAFQFAAAPAPTAAPNADLVKRQTTTVGLDTCGYINGIKANGG